MPNLIDPQTNINLADYTTLQIGGPAKLFYHAQTQRDLLRAIKYAQLYHESYLVIGGGSNLLINDVGTDLFVIKNSVSGITRANNDTITVQSGTPLQQLVDYSIQHGLVGFHKLTGIPGTVGGAIYGNAGAYGQTISQNLIKIKAFDGQKQILLDKTDCGFDYRYSDFKNNHLTILEATFKFESADSTNLTQESAETLEKRLIKYPPGIKCPGSFFKNLLAENLPQEILDTIPNVTDYYGKVPSWIFLERVGAKGIKKGAIVVADFHANLIYNTGGGTAQDFWDLTHDLAIKVKQKFNVTLEPEVQFINLPDLL